MIFFFSIFFLLRNLIESFDFFGGAVVLKVFFMF